MEYSANDYYWRSAYSREQMVAKLDEAILHATVPLSITDNAKSIENYVYNRSNSYQSYIEVIRKVIGSANPQLSDCYCGSHDGPKFVYPEEPGWEHQLSRMRLSNNLAKIPRNRLMGISELERPKRPVLQPYSPLWNEECVFADSNTTSNDSEIEDKRKSLIELQKEVLIAQKKLFLVWERAALQQIEVQMVQLQMLAKMSDLMAEVNEKIQLITDLHNQI